MSRNLRDLDLGVIGNCEVSALIDSDARIVWGCLPRVDGDPVFCALLDSDRDDDAHGLFAIELVRSCRHASQRYLRNTAVLETPMTDASGNRLRSLDFCPRFRSRGRMFRPVDDRAADRTTGGTTRGADARCDPRFDHGARSPRMSRRSAPHRLPRPGLSHSA